MKLGALTSDRRVSDPLTAALEWLARGCSVIPVPRPRPGVPPGTPGDGKVPAMPWREYQTRRPTEAEIRAWFSRGPSNLAIITGAVSGVVVVDCDDDDALRWWTRHRPYTPWQVRTSRGWHLYYGHPGVPIANRARLGTREGRLLIDVRGDGGYVIGPGSIHASGAPYRYAGDWSVPRAQLPRLWVGWLARPEERPPAPIRASTRPIGDRAVIDRARRYLAAIPRPEIGAGSDRDTLYAACRLVRGYALSETDAIDLLWGWAGGREGWTRDWIARKVAHAARYGTEPIGGLVSR
jgi:hypothetical protein